MISFFEYVIIFFSVKLDEIYTISMLLTVGGAVTWFIPLHWHLQAYSYIIAVLMEYSWASAIFIFTSKYIANYLTGVLESRNNFPLEAIYSRR